MREIFEKLYEENKTIWTVKNPPPELMELVESKKILPGKALDIGCGEGRFSLYLAKNGFDVTGIDFSEVARQRAENNAKKENVQCVFRTMDALSVAELHDSFDFVFEWGLLHLIMPPQRRKYLSGIKKVLKSGGGYMSASLSHLDSTLGNSGLKYRVAPASSLWLYYSTHAELKELFSDFFEIIESTLTSIPTENGGRPMGNYFLLRQK